MPEVHAQYMSHKHRNFWLTANLRKTAAASLLNTNSLSAAEMMQVRFVNAYQQPQLQSQPQHQSTRAVCVRVLFPIVMKTHKLRAFIDHPAEEPWTV